MDSECDDSSLDLDDSDIDSDYNDLVDAQGSGSRRRSSSISNSKDDDLDVGLDRSKAEIWGVKRARQGGCGRCNTAPANRRPGPRFRVDYC